MAVRADSLCTLSQVELVLGVDATLAPLREAAIDAATGAILSWTSRKIIHNPGLATSVTELQDGGKQWDSVFTAEFPIASVTSLHDDPDRDYGAATLLTEGEHFLVYGDEGRIQLISNSGLSILTRRESRYFYEGFQNIRVVYVPGYTNYAALPDDLTQACVEWAIYILNKQEHAGMVEVTMSLCRRVFERLSKNGPPPHIKTLLAPHRSPSLYRA